jgi:type II secretory pathway pseudopilin PulG
MKRTFALIEIVVVMAIVVVLTSIILIAAFSSVSKSRIVKTQADLAALKAAISALYMDTSRFILGCPAFVGENPEAALDESMSPAGTYWIGLVSKPNIGVPPAPYAVSTKCEWKAEHVDAWEGPYLDTNNVYDHWKNPYWYDPDYDACCNTWVGNVSLGQVGIVACRNLDPDSILVTECEAACGPALNCPGDFDVCPPPLVMSYGADEWRDTCDDIILGLTLKK